MKYSRALEDEMQQQEHRVADHAVSALYENHAPPIFAYLRLHTRTREDAEDLLVEIFVAALERECFMQLREDEQRAWLWRVARNKVVDYFRMTKRRLWLTLDAIAETMCFSEEKAPEWMALQDEECSHLRASIQQLSPQQQHVLYLRFVHNLRCSDIADVLGKREGTVRMFLSRTLNTLRTIYEKS